MERALISAGTLAAACLLDALVGDPPALPHPVRFLGRVILFLEQGARFLFRSPTGLRVAGFLLVLLAAGGAMSVAALLLSAAHGFHPAAGVLLEVYILFTVLAGRDLRDHVAVVGVALEKGNLKEARLGTAMLVSRETGALDEEGLSRAVLESLFENTADGLVAPLFFAALGGPVAAVFYKTINTLDSMIGYRTERYKDFGFCAAKTDDLFSFIPARLTALAFIITGGDSAARRRSLQVLKKDHGSHESPNSAWPEAAAAGALGVRLGGADRYGDELRYRPPINATGRRAQAADIKRGLILHRRAAVFSVTLLLLGAWLLRIGEVFSL